MNILIDADGCPVVDLTLQIAKQFGIPVIILCDTSHQIEREGAQTLVFDKGADSVDFALVNRVKPGDLVVTQDYGLASMCLARCARVLNQNGLEYTADNMDALLLRRYENKKLLRAGKHPKGSPKRTKAQDEAFASTLTSLLKASDWQNRPGALPAAKKLPESLRFQGAFSNSRNRLFRGSLAIHPVRSPRPSAQKPCRRACL